MSSGECFIRGLVDHNTLDVTFMFAKLKLYHLTMPTNEKDTKKAMFRN